MPIITELALSTESTSRDRWGTRERTRTFRALTRDEQVARDALFQEKGVRERPATPHPLDPFLLCDRISCSPDDGTLILSASYTNNGSRASRFVTRNDPFWKRYTPKFTDLAFSVPYAEATKRVLPNRQQGQQATEEVVWFPKEFKSTQTASVVSSHVVVPAVTLAQNAIIAAQHNKLHLGSDGNYYLFRGADIEPFNNDQDEIKYTWVFDPGSEIPDNPTSGPGGGLYCFPQEGQVHVTRREPYSRIVIGRLGGNAGPNSTSADLPVFHLVYDFEADDLGWQTMPGASQLL